MSLFRKEGFEIWGCSFVFELKLRSTSSAEKFFSDEITWITWKTNSVHARTWSNEKTADMDGLRYSPDDPYYRFGPVHTCLDVRVRETGDWDIFLGPLEWARLGTGGADRWVL